jgi:hypothetical protein
MNIHTLSLALAFCVGSISVTQAQIALQPQTTAPAKGVEASSVASAGSAAQPVDTSTLSLTGVGIKPVLAPNVPVIVTGPAPAESALLSSIVSVRRTSDKKSPLAKYGDTFQINVVNGTDAPISFALTSIVANVKEKKFSTLTETRVAELKEAERQRKEMWNGLIGALAMTGLATGEASATASNMALIQVVSADMTAQSESSKELKSKETAALMEHYANSALKGVVIEPFGTTGGFVSFEKLKSNQDVDMTVTIGVDTHRFSFRRKQQ